MNTTKDIRGANFTWMYNLLRKKYNLNLLELFTFIKGEDNILEARTVEWSRWKWSVLSKQPTNSTNDYNSQLWIWSKT